MTWENIDTSEDRLVDDTGKIVGRVRRTRFDSTEFYAIVERDPLSGATYSTRQHAKAAVERALGIKS